jgi:UDP-N-acetylmuramoyl-tripeptide--D-alanyl-D-alanine ligase
VAVKLALEFILNATGGTALSRRGELFDGLGTDTRKSLKGQIFLAIKGDRFDGHDFLKNAVEQGALALIIDKATDDLETLKSAVTVIQVKNTLQALQSLAQAYRKTLKTKIVGITGSNGKTTTKEFAAAILSEQFKVSASQKSFNNHFGVPLTILEIPSYAQVALLEMGMNHAGEITELSKIAEPDIVVCTTVGRAHIGNFSNGIQGVAAAKEEIYLANPKAIQIFNHDNEFTHQMFERASKARGTDGLLVYSAFTAGADVSLRANRMDLTSMDVIGHIKGIKGEARVGIFGRHNIVNLMAAASIAVVLKMEPEQIWKSMSKCKTGWGRNQLFKLPNGSTILFDAYNANPDSMSLLIKNTFELQCAGKKVAILGEMLELGAEAEKAHVDLGEAVANTDIEHVWFYGPSYRFFEIGFKRSGTSKTIDVSEGYDESLAKKVLSMLNPSDIVILKASRGMRMEQVLQSWLPAQTKQG